MRHILVNGIHIITGFKLLLPGYSAITLFGVVFMRKSYIDALHYLDTILGQYLINHEKIHILQKKTVKLWTIFYMLYLWYFLKLYVCTLNWRMSYKTIPFEMEAYENQTNGLSKSNWKIWTMSNKERKEWYKNRYIR